MSKPGRPAHEPTKETRDAVQVMAAAGVNHDAIAAIVGISDETLRKHYAPELAHGNAKVVAAVAGNLVKRALGSGPDAVNAAKFFLERRGGEAWRSTVDHNHNVTVTHEERVKRREEALARRRAERDNGRQPDDRVH